MSAVLIYMTAAHKKEAQKIVSILLKEKLIACGNIFPVIESHYIWKGRREISREVPVLIKTTRKRMRSVVSRVKSLHSYDCPCVITFNVTGGNRNFLKWIDSQVS